jgi:hypothetical protein
MIERGIDRLSRALAAPHSRRRAMLAAAAALLGAQGLPAAAKRRATGNKPKNQRQHKNKDGKKKGKKSTIPGNCERFVISAGPDKNDKFKHIDDDLLIELIPKGGKGGVKVLLNDHDGTVNGTVHGKTGRHLSVDPFTAKVGDQIFIRATNAQKGGCELDDIWLHCIEGRGGEMQLTKRIRPEKCDGDQLDRPFLETRIRIR